MPNSLIQLTNTAIATLAVGALLVAGCSDEPDDDKSASGYSAEIRWTEGGIPHVKGETLGDASFGSGYAFAKMNVCTMADQLVKVNGRRASFFGRGKDDVHLESDFLQRFLRVREKAEKNWAAMSEDSKAMFEGFVAGYNHYIEEVGPAGLPVRCRNKKWVTKIEALDAVTYMNDLALVASSRALPLLPLVNIHPTPPKKTAAADPAPFRPFRKLQQLARAVDHVVHDKALLPQSRFGIGSNGWALGKEKSANGKGMVLANPHFPWDGELKFWQVHVTVPGVYDVAGAALYGSPIPNLGTNKSMAWTHTVSKSSKFTAYRLKIAPGDPTSYLYDGKPRKMTSHDAEVKVLKDDGTFETVKRTYWSSHYGPIVAIGGVADWTDKGAFTIRDANTTNFNLLDHFLQVGQAKDIKALETVMKTVQANPWVNTIAADDQGNAFYAESNSVPNLSKASYDAHAKAIADGDGLVDLLYGYGFFLLDGSNSRDEWQVEEGSREPGLVPWSKTPHYTRPDYVTNSNESYWFANAKHPLTGYGKIFGKENARRSLRTRITVGMVEEKGKDAPAGEDGKFTVDELKAVPFNNRILSGELLAGGVVEMCKEVTSVTVKGDLIALDKACDAITKWDRKVTLDSRGAILWREFIGQYQQSLTEQLNADIYVNGFDEEDVLNTPNTLRWKNSKGKLTDIVEKFGRAVQRLNKAKIPLDAKLGDWQFTLKNGVKMPVPGGFQPLGCFNIASYSPGRATTIAQEIPRKDVIHGLTDLTKTGYVVNYGSSILMAVGFGANGPEGWQLLTYSNSSEHDSPHFKDQTEMYAKGKMLKLRYTDDDIKADATFKTETVASK